MVYAAWLPGVYIRHRAFGLSVLFRCKRAGLEVHRLALCGNRCWLVRSCRRSHVLACSSPLSWSAHGSECVALAVVRPGWTCREYDLCNCHSIGVFASRAWSIWAIARVVGTKMAAREARARVGAAMRPNLSLNPDASPAALARRPLGAG